MSTVSATDATHDPALESWVPSANAPGDFPLQNLPFGVFRRKGTAEEFRGGVAIGDQILDLAALAARAPFTGAAAAGLVLAAEPSLNALMGSGPVPRRALRAALSQALRRGAPLAAAADSLLVPQGHAELAVPARVGDFTDFYASIHHATAVGRLFRPDNPLLPNYKWIPIAYHGRASSIRVSGVDFFRPQGQLKPPGDAPPVLGATQRLDYELELGVFVGAGSVPGAAVPLREAEDHVFGLCLLNDWSARDVQAWEYQPLGPFLAKNFATTVSPWVVTLEALAPFRTALRRPGGEPAPLPYLDGPENRNGAFDIGLEAWLETAAMRRAGRAAVRLSHSSFADSWWTAAQMLTHHSVNGCTLRPGDLLGTGTQSGPAPDEAGSLLELTRGGREPLELGEGESRTFLEDGDRVILRGACERPGARRIGFGEASATVLPALPA